MGQLYWVDIRLRVVEEVGELRPEVHNVWRGRGGIVGGRCDNGEAVAAVGFEAVVEKGDGGEDDENG